MDDRVLLAHGSGGVLSHELIEDVFARHFANPLLDPLGDSAVADTLPPGRLAFTTDSYVVQPLFFPGGDIGKLAVCGTVNDVAVVGATPLYLSAGFILEEGLPMATLQRIVVSMAETAQAAGVQIVTGDTKVVNRGAADGLFINTAGVGVVPVGVALGPRHMCPGDAILVNGTLGDHGIAVMLKREGLAFGSTLESDCAPLNGLVATILHAAPGMVRCMRDATRGGLATVLNEWVTPGMGARLVSCSSGSGPHTASGDSHPESIASGPEAADAGGRACPERSRRNLGIEIEEADIPVREGVRAACEFLGLDPLYAANEGKLVVAVAPEAGEAVLTALRAHPLGGDAALIGHVTAEHAGRVVIRTPYGGRRILQMLTGAQLPRIC
jgi:hydrogenase expression/formation protein HypE